MPIGSNTADINMVNIMTGDTDGHSWQSTYQVFPTGSLAMDAPQQLAWLKANMPQINTLRVQFNEYSFDANGNLAPQYETFLAEAAAQGYKLVVLYAGGDVQNIGNPDWVRGAGDTPYIDAEGVARIGHRWGALSETNARAALIAQQVETRAAWVKMLNWLDRTGNDAVQQSVWGYELMNEAAGYRHSINSNNADGLTEASFVRLYADHNIALANLLKQRTADGRILVEGWGYGGDFHTLDETQIGTGSALDYIRAGIGERLVWSAHLYPGWLNQLELTDPQQWWDELTATFAMLQGDDVIVTETNTTGTVDNPDELPDHADYFAACFEWFADNGIGIGWFPLNDTGSSSLIWFSANNNGVVNNQIRNQHALAHAMNAWSLADDPVADRGAQDITARQVSVRLFNMQYQQDAGEAPFDFTQTGAPLLGWAFGHGGNDTLRGTSLSNDFLYGGKGNDLLIGLAGDDFLFGQDGNDVLSGAGLDHLFGGRGADRLSTTGAQGIMSGGLGDDTYLVDSASDVLREFGRGGTDRVETALASFALQGSGARATGLSQIENLTYTGVTNFSGTGNALNNLLISGAGDDSLSGGGGNDTLVGGSGADSLTGGAGTDWASYASSTTALNVDLALRSRFSGDALGDVLTGIENLLGGSANDTLRGSDGVNLLSGATGHDILWSYAGNDRLIGGTGADTFEYRTGYDADVIVDFVVGLDRLRFSHFDDMGVAGVLSRARQIGANVIFDFGNGDTLTLLDVQKNQLGAEEITFL